jgi:hypothetical protein
VPRPGDIPLLVTNWFEMKGIDGREFDGAGYCDEIVNNGLMEIATGERPCFQCLEGNNELDLLQSVACGMATE